MPIINRLCSPHIQLGHCDSNLNAKSTAMHYRLGLLQCCQSFGFYIRTVRILKVSFYAYFTRIWIFRKVSLNVTYWNLRIFYCRAQDFSRKKLAAPKPHLQLHLRRKWYGRDEVCRLRTRTGSTAYNAEITSIIGHVDIFRSKRNRIRSENHGRV